jgi:hypothetical protein
MDAPRHLSPALARAFGGQPAISHADPSSTAHQLTGGERRRLRFAAARAQSVYPGPVGELISRELVSWEQFGYRVGGRLLIVGLVDSVEQADRERGERRRAARTD